MRNLRKLLALTLVFALVMGIGLTATALDPNAFVDGDDLDPRYANSVDLLMALGILQGKGENNLDPEGVYTRAEMAHLTALIMLGGDTTVLATFADPTARAASGVEKFTDVWDGDWFAGSIYYLRYIGVVGGRPDGSFAPREDADRVEVAAFALGVIGYDRDIQGYVGAAWRLAVQRDAAYCNLYKNIPATAATNITRQEVFQMFDNALMNDSIRYNPVTGQPFYTADADGNRETVLEFRFRQYQRVMGVLVANQYASVSDSVTKEKGRVYVGGFSVDNVDDMSKAPVAMLGRTVYAYVGKTNIPNRYDGLLAKVIPTDEENAIKLADDDGYAGVASRILNNSPYFVDNYKPAGFAWDYSGNTTIASATSLAGLFTNTKTEAFAYRTIGRNYYNSVIINTWTLVKVTAVADGKVTAVRFNDANTKAIDAKDAASFEFGDTLEEGDVVLALINSDGPVTVKPVDTFDGVLTHSVWNTKATVDGTVYDINTTYLVGADIGNALYEKVTKDSNFGAERTFFLFPGTTKIIGVINPADAPAAPKTYAVILQVGQNTLGYGRYIEVLKDDGTKGVYRLGSNQTEAVLTAAMMGKTTADMFSYTLNAAGDTINLSAVDEYFRTADIGTGDDGATPNANGAVKESLAGATYTKGRSTMTYAGGTLRLGVKPESLIFALNTANNNYMVFRGYGSESFTNLANTGDFNNVFARDLTAVKAGDSFASAPIRFACVRFGYTAAPTYKYGILASGPRYTEVADNKVQLSFDMWNISDKKDAAEFKVVAGKVEGGADYNDGFKSAARKNDLIRFELNGDGEISSFTILFNTATTTLNSNEIAANGWYPMYITEGAGGNFRRMALTTPTTPATGIAKARYISNNDTLWMIFDGTNTEYKTNTDDVFNKLYAADKKYIEAWVLAGATNANNETMANIVIARTKEAKTTTGAITIAELASDKAIVAATLTSLGVDTPIAPPATGYSTEVLAIASAGTLSTFLFLGDIVDNFDVEADTDDVEVYLDETDSYLIVKVTAEDQSVAYYAWELEDVLVALKDAFVPAMVPGNSFGGTYENPVWDGDDKVTIGVKGGSLFAPVDTDTITYTAGEQSEMGAIFSSNAIDFSGAGTDVPLVIANLKLADILYAMGLDVTGPNLYADVTIVQTNDALVAYAELVDGAGATEDPRIVGNKKTAYYAETVGNGTLSGGDGIFSFMLQAGKPVTFQIFAGDSVAAADLLFTIVIDTSDLYLAAV